MKKGKTVNYIKIEGKKVCLDYSNTSGINQNVFFVLFCLTRNKGKINKGGAMKKDKTVNYIKIEDKKVFLHFSNTSETYQNVIFFLFSRE